MVEQFFIYPKPFINLFNQPTTVNANDVRWNDDYLNVITWIVIQQKRSEYQFLRKRFNVSLFP